MLTYWIYYSRIKSPRTLSTHSNRQQWRKKRKEECEHARDQYFNVSSVVIMPKVEWFQYSHRHASSFFFQGTISMQSPASHVKLSFVEMLSGHRWVSEKEMASSDENCVCLNRRVNSNAVPMAIVQWQWKRENDVRSVDWTNVLRWVRSSLVDDLSSTWMVFSRNAKRMDSLRRWVGWLKTFISQNTDHFQSFFLGRTKKGAKSKRIAFDGGKSR